MTMINNKLANLAIYGQTKEDIVTLSSSEFLYRSGRVFNKKGLEALGFFQKRMF